MDDIRRYFLYIGIGGFGIGVLVRSFFDFGVSFGIFILFLSLACAVGYVLKRTSFFFVLSFILLGAALGMVRFDIADRDRGNPILNQLASEGASVRIEGVVADEPDLRESYAKLLIEVERVEGVDDDSLESLTGSRRVLVTTNLLPRFSYGDRVTAEGTLSYPVNFESETGRDFDYISYLAKDDIFFQIRFAEVERLGSGEGNPIRHTLFKLKEAFLERVVRVIPDPEASLLGGLVVGAKQSLGEKLQDDFRRTGIIHIVVLSGYNVTIVALFISKLFLFLPFFASTGLSLISIALFAVMTGASATIVRASIMAGIVILAKATGRTGAMLYILFLAGFIMVLHNPKILVFDPSFQLSFTATLGLLLLSPKLERYFSFIPQKFHLREFTVATIATQLFVFPMILYMMGELSLVALPVNLLILSFVPLTMLLGFLTGMVGFVSTLLSLPFAYGAHALLSYELLVVELFARLPFASVEVNYFPFIAVLAIYILYAYALYRFYRKPPPA